MISITQTKGVHIHITIALTSGYSYNLILHDCCLSSPEYILLHPCNDSISTYPVWMNILSANEKATQEPSQLTNILQNSIYLSDLMSPKPNSQLILMLVTANGGQLEDAESYENMGTQLASLGMRCMIISLEERVDYRMMQLLSRVKGVYVKFSEMGREVPQQNNLVRYMKDKDNSLYFKMNSNYLFEEGLKLISTEKAFINTLTQFLLEPSIFQSKALSKTNTVIMELDTYTLNVELTVIKRTRESESFKVKLQSNKLKASILWKPNLKLIYKALLSKGRTLVSINLKTTSAICNTLLNESSTSFRLLAPQLESFISFIHSTDHITQRIQELRSDFYNLDILQELASIPLCTYHKWFDIKIIDVVYITKIITHKSRASYLTDYLLFKRQLEGIFTEIGLKKVKDSALLTYVLSYDNCFIVVKPIFFASNAASIYLCCNTEAQEERIRNKLRQLRKLRVFIRPLHLLMFWQPIQELLAYYRNMKDMGARLSMTDTFLKDIEEENREVSLEEAERELELQQEKRTIGASIFTYVPFKDTVRCYMDSKKWTWSCPYPVVLKSFVSILVKQRHSEGFLLVSGYEANILFVKEETIVDCSLTNEGRILLFYVIQYSEQRVDTEFYIEKKDAQNVNMENTQLFDEMSNEIYRIDIELSKIIWSYHDVKRVCLRKCANRKLNSLKYCGFYFDTAETTASGSFVIRLFTVFMEGYKIYSERKYKEVSVEDKGNKGRFIFDLELVCGNSVLLDVQQLIIPEFGNTKSKSMLSLSDKEHSDTLSYIKDKIIGILEELADGYLGSGEEEKVYGKFVGRKQVILISITSPSDYQMLIEYKKLSKDYNLESKLMNTQERRKQIAKKEKHKEDFKDELMIFTIEDTELDTEIFNEPEIHEVHLELKLLKVIKNFELYLTEEYNGLLLLIAYELMCKNHLGMEALELILSNSHRFTFSFDITSILAVAPLNSEISSLIDKKLKELISTFFKEVIPGYYYYYPKEVANYKEADRALCNELEVLFAELGKTDKLPLFVKFNVTFTYLNGTKQTRVVDKFSEILVEENKQVKATLQVITYFIGKHKEYKGERYYEKKDMEDHIITEEYYDRFSEGIVSLENSLPDLITNKDSQVSNVTINIDEYLYQTKNILYPFQAPLFAQLIPENYSKGSLVFTVNYQNTRAIYSIMRSVKVFLSELFLFVVLGVPLCKMNEDVMRYVRLKMGELYLGGIKSQVFNISFIDYSEQRLSMLVEEMNSMRLNIRNIDSYYYVVWNISNEMLELENISYKKISNWYQEYKVKYWILLSYVLEQSNVHIQVIINFGFTGNCVEDCVDYIKIQFADAFDNLANRMNKRILLNQLSMTKECPDKLFPLSNKQEVLTIEKREKRNRGKSRHYKIYDTLNKVIEKAHIEENGKNSADLIKEPLETSSYTLDLLLTKEIQVTSRVSISNLTDPRYRFFGSFEVRNRPYMYVIETGKAIYVLKFSEGNTETPQKQGDCSTLIMEIYGIEEAESDFIEKLIINVESQLMTIALTKIAHSIRHNVAYNSGLLSFCDYQFLAESEDKIDLLFPLFKLNDSYAFMKYVAQNLKRFMITYELGMTNKRYVEMRDDRLIHSIPTIIKIANYDRAEKFVFERDDPDFSLIYNFMNEVNDIILGQVFGNALCLLNMSILILPLEKCSIDNLLKDAKNYTEHYMDRYVSLLKYNKNTSKTEYISIFNEKLEVVTEVEYINKAFVYPIIIKDKEDKSQYKEPNKWNKYLRLSLSVKGRLNLDEFLDSIILYTNQSIIEYITESSFEIIELNILKALKDYTLSLQDKGKVLLNCIEHFKEIMNKVKKFAVEIKSYLFYYKEISIKSQHWSINWLVAKMVNEICTKYIITQVPQNQLECLCIFLVISVVGNTDGQVLKTYVLKNIHIHDALYSFLKKTFTFQSTVMRNCYLNYQFIVFSKAIPELSSIFPNQILDQPIVFIDCLAHENARNRKTFIRNAFESLGIEDTVEEILVSLKARQNIPMRRNGLNVIPRTLFLHIIIERQNIKVNAYNFGSKIIKEIEEIIYNIKALSVKYYEGLNIMVMKKLGIVNVKEHKEVIENTLNEINGDVGLMKELVAAALKNRSLNELNKFSVREKSFTRKVNVYNSAEFNVNLKEIEFEIGSCSSDQAKILEFNSKLSKDVIHSYKSLKYLCINPFHYHLISMNPRIKQFKSYKNKLLDCLHLYTQYGHRLSDEVISEQREAEDRLFKHLNLAEVPKKEEGKLMESLKSLSTLSYNYIIPFMFTCDYNKYVNAETGKILFDIEKIKTAYLGIFADYFRGLCEMIKVHCNVIEIFLGSEKPSLRVQEWHNLEPSLNWRRYFANFETQIETVGVIELESKPRKVTLDSSPLSHKDSEVDAEERCQLLSHPAHTSLAHLLQPTQSFQVEECRQYFLNISQGAAYVIELEWVQSFFQINLWTLPRIFNIDYLPPMSRAFIENTKGLQDSSELQVDHTVNSMISMLKMDMMNYDLHVQFFLHVVNGFREQRGLIDVVNTFMQYYPEPPKKAKNRVSASLLTINMGEFEDDTEEFWRHFITNASMYNYKLLKCDQVVFSEITNPETILDSNDSRKQSKDEEKRDSTSSQSKRLQENYIYKDSLPETYERKSNSRKGKKNKKSIDFSSFPQLGHDDSVNERGNNLL